MLDGEQDIIKRAIKGEASAFGLLYDKYQPQIYRFVYLKVSHREAAEDLTHQVFLNAWQKIENYKFRGFPFSSWLYSIARNQIIDYYRVQKTNISSEEAIELEVELTVENPIAKNIDNNLDKEKVRRAIKKLKAEHQNVVILRFIEELSVRETAAAIGKTPLAVKLIQHRAVKNLKKIINNS